MNPLLHKLSLISCSLALALPLQAGEARKDQLTAPPDARPAERFGSRSKWVIGLEGLANFRHHHLPEQRTSFTGSGGGTVRTTSTGSSDDAALLMPRLGVDWFALEHVSIGVAARYSQGTSRGSSRIEGDGINTSTGYSSSMRGFSVSPRIGLAFTSAQGFGVWARAQLDQGTTWYTNRSSGGPSASGSLAGLAGGNATSQTHWASWFGASIEALGTYAPRDDVVLMAGPWVQKLFASFQDPGSGVGPTDAASSPPAYGLTVGAGLFL